MSKLSYRDVSVLQSRGFIVGQYGASYFGFDYNGDEWQVLLPVHPHETALTFVAPNRESSTMTREVFDETFP